MILRVLFIIYLLLFFTACNDTKKNWINNTILSEKNILLASSINVKSILEKSAFENIENITDEQKIIFNAIKSFFISKYLGIDIDSPQRLFIVSQENKFNAATFIVGEITNKYLFKESIKRFLEIDSFSAGFPTICYSEKYNFTIGFNSSHFILGFSLDKNFTLDKINSYFQSKPINNNNHLLSVLLNKSDDYAFYISNSNMVDFINSIKIPFIKSQLINYLNMNLLTEDFILDMNFLNGKIDVNTLYSVNSSNISSLSPVDKKYKNFLSCNDSLLSFGFANIPLKKIKKYFNLIIKFIWDLEKQRNRFDLSGIYTALDGSLSFSFNKPLNPLINLDSRSSQNNSINHFKQNKNAILKYRIDDIEDNWEDDDFFEEEELAENLNITTPYIISLGIGDKQFLVEYFHKNNLELKEDKLLNVNNTFFLFKSNVLHWTNNLKLIDYIHMDETKPYSKIKESHFQKPVYIELDLEAIFMVYFPKTILDDIDEKQKLRQTFNNVIITSSKNGFHIEFGLKQKDKNALQLFLEAIMENKTLKNYL